VSFEPITRWVLRCDGAVGHGRCPDRWVFAMDVVQDDAGAGVGDEKAGEVTVWAPVVFDEPELTEQDRAELDAAGWLLARDGRLLCPRHVAAQEYLVHAAIDGLPLDEASRGSSTEKRRPDQR
jgi:hypothetical protein